jgi:hypothetical protein
MAGNRLSISLAGVGITTAFKTIIDAQAPTNHGMVIESLEFGGLTSSTSEKIEYQVLVGHTGGTSGSTPDVANKSKDMDDETHGVTPRGNFSGEPTGGRIIKRGVINGLGGDRFGVGIRLNPGERICLQAKAVSTNTLTSTMHVEV